MKNSKTLFGIFPICAILITFGNSCRNNSVNKTDYPADSVIVVIQNFYTSYINCWTIRNDRLTSELIQESDSIKNVYCTRRLINLLHDLTKRPILDWDPFLDAQIIDTHMINTLTINKDSISPNLFVVSYKYGPTLTKIRLIILKDGSKYKIDSLPDIPLEMIKKVRSTSR
jgi:hypothetical protein